MRLILRTFFWQQIPEHNWDFIQYEIGEGRMEDKSNTEKALERILTGLALVALTAVFFISATDLDPLILLAVS